MNPTVPVGSISAAPSSDRPDAGDTAGDKGDLIDRLAALFQRARLWQRRARRQLVEARATGNPAAIHVARLRYGRACHWHAVLYRRYVQAVFAVYC